MSSLVDKVPALQATPERVRNICILAHVDHGKTTLSDSLVAANGFISNKLAGKLRFLDSTEEEQRRCITMEASCISLVHQRKDEEFLVNLIDSPGHVDFSSDVSTAVRLCDGALVVVDVVEGVCTQTQAVLRQAWEERVRPCLVLNKLDRLVKELCLSPSEAYDHLQRVIEQVNAITSSFVTAAAMDEAEEAAADELDIDDETESRMLFAPERGNVAFASAHDCWAFRLDTFARIWSRKLDLPMRRVSRALWGEHYFVKKTGKIARQPPRAAANPMFVEMVLAPIWAAYDALVVSPDAAKVARIVRSLGLSVPENELGDAQAVMSRWLPLARCVLNMVADRLPSPVRAQADRVERIWPAGSDDSPVRAAIAACDAGPDAPVVVFVSKMYCVGGGTDGGGAALLGFARVFSGTLRAGAPVHVLGPKYRGEGSGTDEHAVSLPAGAVSVHLVLGREFFPLAEAAAGNIVAIGGLDEAVLKSATLSSTLACPSLLALSYQSKPIVRVAVSAAPADMPRLEAGLRLLYKADPCVEVTANDLGEWIVAALGEMHLEHCVKELRERYAGVEAIDVSAPIVGFRETVVQPSALGEPVWTPNRAVALGVRALPLPVELPIGEEPDLAAVAEALGLPAERVWAVGPPRMPANVLVVAEGVDAERLGALASGIVSGFHMAAAAGPLCDEPMTGVMFELASVSWADGIGEAEGEGEGEAEGEVDAAAAADAPPPPPPANDDDQPPDDDVVSHGPLSGQIISTMRAACRAAVERGAARLVQALYRCALQCDAEFLGRLYAVISRRRGRVLQETMWEGTAIFNIVALLPVVESFGFSDELRERTSGAGTSPQLVFSHWETIADDPFFQPTTEDEREEHGEEVNVTNYVRDYVDAVRRRKGLQTETKIVVHAEKQRTRARKK